MSANSFRFKHFAVEQEGCAMKVGTDGVLLGAWCRIEPTDKAILDVGTGTGVIALQLAQRTREIRATIEAVEIDKAAADRARLNFAASEWGDRLKLHHISLRKFAGTPSVDAPAPCGARFDHIVSNPPFFVDSLTSPVASRTTARHANTLPYSEFIAACDTLLKPDGHISIILPAGVEAKTMIAEAAARNFTVTRRTEVHSTPKSGLKRILLEFSRHTADLVPVPVPGTTPARLADVGTPTVTLNPVTALAARPATCPAPDTLVVEDAGPGSFSAEYRALTHDFYLYF